MKTKLPNKLSALILLALDDLKKAERSKKYKIDMTNWHVPNSHCSVCFAGAVMAFSLKTDPKETLFPESFDRDTCRKLDALDDARCGRFSDALYTMDKSARMQDNASVFDVDIPGYYIDRKGFHSTLRKSALALQKAGL